MATFSDIWKTLNKSSTGEERSDAYSKLTSLLKDAASSGNYRFSSTLSLRHSSLTERILRDIKECFCSQAAIQALGYLLYSPEYAERFTRDQVKAAITGLCDVISTSSTSRNLCTRALWCLANQNFSSDQIQEYVTLLINTITKVLVTQVQATPTVDNEAFNLYARLEEQCGEHYKEMAITWYKGIVVRILFSKNNKLQKRGLEMVVKYEEVLSNSSECQHWLVSTLKQQTLEVMRSQLTKKGMDYPHILNTWAHFVKVLGRVLHKRGSFLNELLRVVELGFKHQWEEAQMTAYKAWMDLTTNFAMETTLMTEKCLKLLLMPLLGAAINERTMCVEVARLRAWWHLIVALGDSRNNLFHQVCIPFLMFCVGLNPKMDFNHLLSLASEHKSSSHVITVDTDKQSVLGQGSASTDNKIVLRNKLLDLPRKGSGPQCAAKPTSAMVLAGCSAVLQFLGLSMTVPESLIEIDLKDSAVFPEGVVPLDVAMFLVLFLDCGSQYVTKESNTGHCVDMNAVVLPILSAVINSVRASETSQSVNGNMSDSMMDVYRKGSGIVEVLMQLIGSGSLNMLLEFKAQRDLVTSIVSLPYQFLVGGGSCNVWKQLLNLTIGLSRRGSQRSGVKGVWLSSTWLKIVGLVGSKWPTSDLSNYLYLSEQLPEVAMVGVVNKSAMSIMWGTLAKMFLEFVTKTTRINHGTQLEPDFKAAIQILKFPFDFIFNQSDKSSVKNVLSLWESLYDVSLLHATLIAGDPSHFPLLVCQELCTSYSNLRHLDVLSAMDLPMRCASFDLYQNSVTTALLFVLKKMKWGKSSDHLTKCVQTIANLISLQLKRFHEELTKYYMNLSHVGVAFTVHDVISTFVCNLMTFDLLVGALETLSSPLAKFWSSLMEKTLGSTVSKDLHNKVVTTWSAIITALQVRGTSPLPTSLVPILKPLLVTTVTIKYRPLADVTLNFWAVEYSQQKNYTWPVELLAALLQYSKQFSSHGLDLSTLSGMGSLNSLPSVSNTSETQSQGTSTQAEATQESNNGNETGGESVDNGDVVVVHPHTSPLEGSRSPFKKRFMDHVSPHKGASSPPNTQVLSPNARALDKVLSRSIESVGQKVESVCRRLSLLRDSQTNYIRITPPTSKKPRLLTDHQIEHQQEKAFIPPSMMTHTQQDEMDVQEVRVHSVTSSEYSVMEGMVSSAGAITVNSSVVSMNSNTCTSVGVSTTPTSVCVSTSVSTIPITAAKAGPSVKRSTENSVVSDAILVSVMATVGTQLSRVPSSSHPVCTSSTAPLGASVASAVPSSDRAQLSTSPGSVSNTFVHPLDRPTSALSSSAVSSSAVSSSAVSSSAVSSSAVSSLSNSLTVSSCRPHYSIAQPEKTSTSKQTPASISSAHSSSQHNLPSLAVSQPVVQSIGPVTSLPSQAHPSQWTGPLPMPATAVPSQSDITKLLLSVGGNISSRTRQLTTSLASLPTNLQTSVVPLGKLSSDELKAIVSQLKQQPGFTSTAASLAKLLATSRPSVQRTTTITSTLPTSAHSVAPLTVTTGPLPTIISGPVLTVTAGTVPTVTTGPVSAITAGPVPIVLSGTTGPVLTVTTGTVPTITTKLTSAVATGPVSTVTTGTVPTVTGGPVLTVTAGPVSSSMVANSGCTGPPGSSPPRSQSSSSTSKSVASSSLGKRKRQAQRTSPATDDTMNPPVAKRKRKRNVSQLLEREKDCPSDKDKESPQTKVVSDSCPTTVAEKEDLEPGSVGGEPGICEVKTGEERTHVSSSSGSAGESNSSLVTPSSCTDISDQSKQSSVNTGQVHSAPEQTSISEASSEGVMSSDKGKSGFPPSTNDTAVSNKNEGIVSTSDQDEVNSQELLSGENPQKTEEDRESMEVGELCGESEDPLSDLTASECEDNPPSDSGHADDQLASPTQRPCPCADNDHTPQSCDTEEAKQQKGGSGTGILKRVSQFDTPCSAKQVGARRVQFASQTDVREVDCNNKGHKVTPIRGRGSVNRNFSSRRMLRMTPANSGNISKTTPPSSPVFPSLVDCPSPVDQILPSLSPSNTFSQGLVQLVRARNITTVGEMSSLTYKQVQTLPIKSPKVPTLRNALSAFSKKLSGGKLRSPSDSESPTSVRLFSRVATTTGQPLTAETSEGDTPMMSTECAGSENNEDSFMVESDPDALSQSALALGSLDSQDSEGPGDDCASVRALTNGDGSELNGAANGSGSSQVNQLSTEDAEDKCMDMEVLEVGVTQPVYKTSAPLTGNNGTTGTTSELSQELFSPETNSKVVETSEERSTEVAEVNSSQMVAMDAVEVEEEELVGVYGAADGDTGVVSKYPSMPDDGCLKSSPSAAAVADLWHASSDMVESTEHVQKWDTHALQQGLQEGSDVEGTGGPTSSQSVTTGSKMEDMIATIKNLESFVVDQGNMYSSQELCLLLETVSLFSAAVCSRLKTEL